MKRLFSALVLVAALAYALPARAADPYQVKIASNTSSAGVAASSPSNASGHLFKTFALQVKGQGATPSHWTVTVEGSIDGTNWAKLFDHSDGDSPADLDGSIKTSTATIAIPVNYFRANVKVLTLGSATGALVTLVGSE